MNGFDPGDHAAPYIQQTMTGGNTGGNRYHWSDSTTLGIGHGDGKSKCLHNIQGDIDVQALSDKAEAWGRVHTHTQDVTTKLQAAYQRVFDNWSGDDADRARKTFGYTVDSAASVRDAAQGMHTGTQQLVTMANSVRGMGGGGPSALGQVAHVESLGLIGAGGDGDQLQPAFDAYCNGLGDAVVHYPSTMEWQVKTAPSAGAVPPISPLQGGDGAGAGGVGGVSAPHLGGGAGHGSVPTTGISSPGAGGTPHQPNPNLPNENGGVPWNGGGIDGGNLGGGNPGGGGDFTGGGAPGLDTGTSLAGYDPSGAFGGGAGGGAPFGGAGGGVGGLGAGGGGVGGLGAAGLGAGGLGGGAAGGLAGAGAGAGGLGAAGGLAGANAAEEASAAQAAEAGAAGRASGQQGLLPMRPGGSTGNDGERERSTWLTEDDDIWGESDAPPSVIS